MNDHDWHLKPGLQGYDHGLQVSALGRVTSPFEHPYPARHLHRLKLQILRQGTGAYDSLEAEILEDVDDVLARSDQVQRLARSFRPPNQDEIDRMLLEG